MTFEKGLLTLLVVESSSLKTKSSTGNFSTAVEQNLQSKLVIYNGLLFHQVRVKLPAQPQRTYRWDFCKRCCLLRENICCFWYSTFYFHILQASFSPKAFHCAAEDTTSNSRKTKRPTKTSMGSFKDMTSFPSILVIKGNVSCIKRKYQKLLPIQKFCMMRILTILASNKSSKTG